MGSTLTPWVSTTLYCVDFLNHIWTIPLESEFVPTLMRYNDWPSNRKDLVSNLERTWSNTLVEHL